jgi:hypothetical protein
MQSYRLIVRICSQLPYFYVHLRCLYAILLHSRDVALSLMPVHGATDNKNAFISILFFHLPSSFAIVVGSFVHFFARRQGFVSHGQYLFEATKYDFHTPCVVSDQYLMMMMVL